MAYDYQLKSISEFNDIFGGGKFDIDKLSTDTTYIELSYKNTDNTYTSYRLETREMFKWFINSLSSQQDDLYKQLSSISALLSSKIDDDIKSLSDYNADTYVTIHTTDEDPQIIDGAKIFDSSVIFLQTTTMKEGSFIIDEDCSPTINKQLTCTAGINCTGETIFSQLTCTPNIAELTARYAWWA